MNLTRFKIQPNDCFQGDKMSRIGLEKCRSNFTTQMALKASGPGIARFLLPNYVIGSSSNFVPTFWPTSAKDLFSRVTSISPMCQRVKHFGSRWKCRSDRQGAKPRLLFQPGKILPELVATTRWLSRGRAKNNMIILSITCFQI